jgi:hypothetical protein
MITTITLERLRKRGYVSLLDVYILLNPSPRSSKVVNLRTAVYENRTYFLKEKSSGVRGALHSEIDGAVYSIMQRFLSLV